MSFLDKNIYIVHDLITPMLNSDFFSKRQFNLNLNGFGLWLQHQFGIHFQNKELDKQIEYYAKYISFINYRTKHIKNQGVKETIPFLNNRQEQEIKSLLESKNISFFRSH